MPKKSVFVILLMGAAALSACNFPLAFEDPDEVENAVAETVAAYEAEVEAVIPTLEMFPTSTPMPTVTTGPVVEETAETEATNVPCNSAIAWDLTIPDNTKFSPGATFDKGWTFRNVGTCTWSSEYQIAFEDGDQMNGPDSKEIGEEVAPNGEVEVVVSLTAPSSAGTYRGNWMLQNADGFDIGPIWVKIIVE